MAIASINAASATSPNWLKEAQEALVAAQSPGGLLGALQETRYDGGSLKNYLARSQNTAANMALIAMSRQTSSAGLIAQMAATAAQQRMAEKAAQAAKFNEVPVNYNPPRELDPFIYFEDGSSIDTANNILTLQDGTQIDTATGIEVIDPASIIQMANGAYLDTKKNILTMPDGTKIDTITGLAITV